MDCKCTRVCNSLIMLQIDVIIDVLYVNRHYQRNLANGSKYEQISISIPIKRNHNALGIISTNCSF